MSYLVLILLFVPFIVVAYIVGALLRRLSTRIALKLTGSKYHALGVMVFFATYACSGLVAYEVVSTLSMSVVTQMMFLYTYLFCSFLAFPAYESTARYSDANARCAGNSNGFDD